MRRPSGFMRLRIRFLLGDPLADELRPVQVEQVPAGRAARDRPEHEEHLVRPARDRERLARPGGGAAGRDQVLV